MVLACLYVFVALVVCGAGGYWWVISKATPAPPPPPEQRPAELVDPDRLRGHVEFLTAEPRNYKALPRLGEIVDYLCNEFQRAGARTLRQPYQIPGAAPKGKAVAYRNVVGRFGAVHADKAAPPPLIVVGAHYDSCGDTPGADDNASGVAALLELAHLLGARNRELVEAGVMVELVAFFGEEPPFFGTVNMGSAVHAQSLRSRGCAILGVLVFEMVGYFSDEPKSQSYPFGLAPGLRIRYGDKGDFIGVVGRSGQEGFITAVHAAMQSVSGVPVHSIAAPASLGGVSLSDHANYWAHGDLAVMITDTAFHRNPNYHKKTDTAETLDYARMAVVVEQTAAAVSALAGGTAPVKEKAHDELAPRVRLRPDRQRRLLGFGL